MTNAKRISLIAAAIIGLFIVILAIVIATFNINAYRTDITNVMTKQFGRAVQLNGPLSFSISPTLGLNVSVQDAAIANPTWASRPQMAGIGKLKLGIALFPLLQHQLAINKVSVQNADIQLETNSAGQHNWDMHPVEEVKPETTQTPITNNNNPVTTKSADQSVAIRVDAVTIKDSQLAMRGKNGETSVLQVKTASLNPEGNGIRLKFDGSYNGNPLTMDVTGQGINPLAGGSWPFNATAAYGNLRLKAKGEMANGAKNITVSEYDLTSGSSGINGKLALALDGERPVINGTITSNQLDPSDFKLPASQIHNDQPSGATPAATQPKSNRIFSDAPLPLDLLNSANVGLDINIGKIPLHHAGLQQITARFDLNNGKLSLNPFKATLAGSEIGIQFGLDASVSPAQLTFNFQAPSLDLGGMLKAVGTKEFLSGKGAANIDITATGDSSQALAGSANGNISLVTEGGSVSVQSLGQIASELANLVAPGVNNSQVSLNCMVVKFKITDGIAKSDGILADTSATTIAGSGGFSLRDETIDMLLHAKPKMINIRGLLPPIRMSGALSNPHYNIDASGTVQNVVGLLSNGSVNSGVPDIITQQGQNACLYTLQHAPAQSAASGSSPNLGTKAKDIGNKLLNGLFGH